MVSFAGSIFMSGSRICPFFDGNLDSLQTMISEQSLAVGVLAVLIESQGRNATLGTGSLHELLVRMQTNVTVARLV